MNEHGTKVEQAIVLSAPRSELGNACTEVTFDYWMQNNNSV